MSARLLILLISIFYPLLTHAVPKPLGLELGKATANDIKRMYKIKEEDVFGDGITYDLDVSSIPNDKLTRAYMWCDPDQVIQRVVLISSRNEFDNMVLFLSSKYKLVDRSPPDDLRFESELTASFKDGDFTIIVDAPRRDHELVIDYYAPKFSNRNYKPK